MLHRKKRVYFAVMIFSGLALFVDRFVLSDNAAVPDAANASLAGVVVRSTDSSVPVAENAPAIPEVPFPRGVERFTFGSEMRDVFAPPLAASSEESRLSGAGGGAAGFSLRGGPRGLKSAARLDRASFEAQHELGGVLTHECLRIVIVDGRWLWIGDKLDGCKLTLISGEAAFFECHNGEALLKTSRGRGDIHD